MAEDAVAHNTDDDEEADAVDEAARRDPEDRIGLDCVSDIANQNGGVGEHGQQFRLANNRVLLTFAALYKGELTPVRAAALLEAKCREGKCVEIVTAEELHTEFDDADRKWHIHAYVSAKLKWDTINHKLFDLIGNGGRVLHPYIQSMGTGVDDRNKVINYLTKDNNYRMRLNSGYNKTEVYKPKEQWGERVRDAENAATAESVLRQFNPDVLYLSGDTILKRKRDEDDAKAVVGEGFTTDSFNVPMLDVSSKPIVLHGKSNTGKTSFAVAHFQRPLLCSTLDTLKAFKAGVHDGIVFDDVDCSKLSPEAAIQLLDVAHTRHIQLRYAPAVIPAGTPRIFTTNVKPKKLFPHSDCRHQRHALKRRYVAVKVKAKLFTT